MLVTALLFWFFSYSDKTHLVAGNASFAEQAKVTATLASARLVALGGQLGEVGGGGFGTDAFRLLQRGGLLLRRDAGRTLDGRGRHERAHGHRDRLRRVQLAADLAEAGIRQLIAAQQSALAS